MAATQVFLSEGFAGASMDAIAAAARVSKPTVYSHLADKQRLFEQIVTDMIAGITQPFYEQIVNLSDDGDLAQHLRGPARLLLTAVMEPANLQLRRLVIGEAGRFPDLGRAYEQHGPQRAIAAWTTAFQRLADKGLLRLDDPALAAGHFNWLVVSIPLNHAMLSGDHRPLPRPARALRRPRGGRLPGRVRRALAPGDNGPVGTATVPGSCMALVRAVARAAAGRGQNG